MWQTGVGNGSMRELDPLSRKSAMAASKSSTSNAMAGPWSLGVQPGTPLRIEK